MVKILPAQELRALGQLHVQTQSQHSFVVSPGKELVHIGSEMDLDSKRKVLSTPELVESLLLPMDPSSILQLAKSGVVKKRVLQKSLSLNVWSSHVKDLSSLDCEQISQEVRTFAEILKFLKPKDPNTFILPLLDQICKKFPARKFFSEVHMKCPARQILTIFDNLLIAGCICLSLEMSLYLTFHHTQSQSQFSWFRCR